MDTFLSFLQNFFAFLSRDLSTNRLPVLRKEWLASLQSLQFLYVMKSGTEIFYEELSALEWVTMPVNSVLRCSVILVFEHKHANLFVETVIKLSQQDAVQISSSFTAETLTK